LLGFLHILELLRRLAKPRAAPQSSLVIGLFVALNHRACTTVLTKPAMSTTSTTTIEAVDNSSSAAKAEPIVQYIAIRNDLKWPKGALIAQGCHASTAAIHLNYADPETARYLSELDTMHKIVVGVADEAELRRLSDELAANGVKFKLWLEQPENTPTSLALKPYSKSLVERFLKPYKLFK
jgi:peptidyl-tRNA hydrolase